MVRRITNEILGVKRLILIGWESGANFLEQTPNEVKKNQKTFQITFDTQLKIVPYFLLIVLLIIGTRTS